MTLDKLLKLGKKSFDQQKTILECFQFISYNIRKEELKKIVTSHGFLSFSHHFTNFLEDGDLSFDFVSIWIILIKAIENQKCFSYLEDWTYKILMHEKSGNELLTSKIRALYMELLSSSNSEIEQYRKQPKFYYYSVNFLRQFREQLLRLEKEIIKEDIALMK